MTMKNLYSTIIASALCLTVLSSCEVEFDFKELDGDPLFLIDGYIRTEAYSPGTGNLQMYLYGVPSAAGEREFSEEARCTLKVYKNSELIDTKDYITIKDFFGLIADDYQVAPGDEILITAESDGFPTASSRTVIPQAPPVAETSCSVSGGNLDIRFSFEDDAATADAYAFRFMTMTTDRIPGENETGYSLDLSFGTRPGSPLADPGPFDVTWEDGIRYYGINDESFNGKRKEFEISTPFELPSGGTTYLRIEIQRISPERINYETAITDKGSNALGFIGLAPVTFAYTNIRAGSGCFSSGNSAYTDWVPVCGGIQSGKL